MVEKMSTEQEQGSGNKEQGSGNKEQGSGNKEQGSGNKRRRSRRRYFKRGRRNAQDKAAAEGGKDGAPAADGKKQDSSSGKQQGGKKQDTAAGDQQSGEKYSRSKSKRNQRARRRRRDRSRRPSQETNSSTAALKEIDFDYVRPESVFIYTHVSRPDQRDSYEFRAETFGGTGRRLEDFDIDLSLLFPDKTDEAEIAVKTDEAEGALDSNEAEGVLDSNEQISDHGDETTVDPDHVY